MEAPSKRDTLLVMVHLVLGIWVLSLFLPQVQALPQDKMEEKFSDDTTVLYDDLGLPIRTTSPDLIKLSGSDHVIEEGSASPFKPVTGHVPGGLPMISDSAFSLTILIYVSVAFLLVFFLFCWKTTNDSGSGSASQDLKQQCPLMTNNPAQPNVIPPTPTPTYDSKLKECA